MTTIAGEKKQGTQILQTGRKILELIDAVARYPEGVSVAELSKHLGWSRAATHQYLATAHQADWLTQDESTKYRISFHVAVLAKAAAPGRAILPVLVPAMRQLAEKLHAPVSFAVLDQKSTMIIERAEPERAVQVRSGYESRVGIRTSASGQVLLAQAGAGGRMMFDQSDLHPDEFYEQILESGYSFVATSWLEDDIWAAAAPVFHHGSCVGALSVIAPAGSAERNFLIDGILAGANDINQRLISERKNVHD